MPVDVELRTSRAEEFEEDRREAGKLILRQVKVKGKVVPVLFLREHDAMKAYWGSEGVALCILDLGARWW
jgi:hypothetical protein